MNLNTLFDKLTNFKIKFTKDPSPVQISNKKLIFVREIETTGINIDYENLEIRFNKDTDTIEIVLSE